VGGLAADGWEMAESGAGREQTGAIGERGPLPGSLRLTLWMVDVDLATARTGTGRPAAGFIIFAMCWVFRRGGNGRNWWEPAIVELSGA